MPQDNFFKKYLGKLKIFYKKTAILVTLLAILYAAITFFINPSATHYNITSTESNDSVPHIETNKNEYYPGENVEIKVIVPNKIGKSDGWLIQIKELVGENTVFSLDKSQSVDGKCVGLCGDFVALCREVDPMIITGSWSHVIKPNDYKIMFTYSDSTELEQCDKFCIPSCKGDKKTINKTIKIKDFGIFNDVIAYSIYFFLKAVPFVFLYVVLVIILNLSVMIKSKLNNTNAKNNENIRN